MGLMEFDEGFGQFSEGGGDSQSVGRGGKKVFCVDECIELGEILEKLER